MIRIALVLGAVLLGAGLRAADDPPARKELTAEERKALAAERQALDDAAFAAFEAAKYDEAQAACERALGVARRLHGGADHTDVAHSLNALAFVLQGRGRFVQAEPLYRDALAMTRRVRGGKDHPDVALAMNNMGYVLEDLGRTAEAEGFYRDALGMRQRLYGRVDHPELAVSLNNLAGTLKARGRLADAEALFRDGLAMRRRVFGVAPHPAVVTGLTNLASVLRARGRLAEAEPLFRDALAMDRRLHGGRDHPGLAQGMNNLAFVLQALGRPAEAEPLYRDALAMLRRVYGRADHPQVAAGLNNLALVLRARGKPADAEPVARDALAMRRRLHGDNDHPELAASQANLAGVLADRGNYADAEPLIRDALAGWRRLLGGADHPEVAAGLNNLASVLRDGGRLADAEPVARDAAAMLRRLYAGPGHPDLAAGLFNLADVLQARGKAAEAGPLLRDALAVNRRVAAEAAAVGAEGDVLTLAASFPAVRDLFLATARAAGVAPAEVYAEVWADKAYQTRAFERRALAARAAAASPAAAAALAALADARRRRAELILAPDPADPKTKEARAADLAGYAETIRKQADALAGLLPPAVRPDKVAAATPADLRRALPAGSAVVDYLALARAEYDPNVPGKKGVTQTPSYAASVVTRDAVAWVDLGPAGPIEVAAGLWRQAIVGGNAVPPDIPARVRKLVWEKVRAELPAGTTTVYVVPDAALTGLPWSALPGDKPDSVLLDDYAVATLPHAPYLLDKLWPQDPRPNAPAGLLAVGGVGFDDAPARPGLWAAVQAEGRPRTRDAAVKAGATLRWKPLPGTAAEAAGVASLAAGRKLDARVLNGERAAAAAVLAALPTARYAHLATHGFFADPSFRSALRLDPKLFEMTQRGERVGAGANSPMVLSGLVFAGANTPGTPGRGIVTGELLVDRDLSGLDLAVLSACETGLGEVAGGEGVFGLARAFHVAGCRDVVASLWKVDDDATAALMNLFYRNLWEKDQPPIEALRRAQLHVYRNPASVPDLAKGLRGTFEVVPGSGATEVVPKPGAGGTAHPRLWAAFVLSGPRNRHDPGR